MFVETIKLWSNNFPYLVFPILIVGAFLLYKGTRFVLARLSYRIALQTETIYDDLIVDRLQPFRFAWLLPLLLVYFYADTLFPDYTFIKTTTLILSFIVVADFLIAFLGGINDVYKNNPRYTGVSVAGYIGLLQVLTAIAAFILAISYITDVELFELLSGVGAWLAVLLLIFRDTILAFLASIQISTQKLIKEGDIVDIPAFDASGIISKIDLQTITIQNWDNTNTSIPTFRIVETGLKNHRLTTESGARRMKQAMLMDVNSIKFVSSALRKKLLSVDFINTQINDKLEDEDTQITNLQLFIHYAKNYLSTIKEIRLKRYPFLIRALEHSPKGLPIEIYIFVKIRVWEKFEEFQADIMIHLFAVMPYFELLSFRED